jgi:mono/diheme cytochrome c family protein
LTWANTGQALMTGNCTSCHGSSGAMGGVSLTTAAQVQAHLSKVDSEVASGSMPPRGSTALTSAQKTSLLNWLACGAP